MSSRECFTYRAARSDGAIEHGLLEATNRESAATVLLSRGLYPIELCVEDAGRSRKARVPAAELALGLKVLGDLLEAGLSMSRALAAFAELAPPSWQAAVPGISESVREGRSLATALERAAIEIPPHVTGLLRAGEAGSALAPAVRRAADMMEEHAALAAAIRSALTYPAVLAIAGAASALILVGVVLPRFALILTDLGASLPQTTRLVLGAGEMARVGALPGTIALTACAFAWRSWVSSREGLRRWHELLLRAPLIGGIRRKVASARMATALAALLEGGVPLPSALTHAARAGGDVALGGRLLASRQAVTAGERLSRAVARTSAMTDTLVHFIRAGEETGRLAALVGHGAQVERFRAERSVRMAVQLIEPAMILVFGVGVALVAAALLQAVYGIRPI